MAATGALLAVLLAGVAGATPTTLMWTPCSIDMQAVGSVHLTYDSYVTLGRGGPGKRGEAFATDLGLTAGLPSVGAVQAEAGFDWMEPSDHPLSFNAKVGVPEGALFTGAPALQAGIFGAGTKRGVTDLNVFDLVTGRSLPAGLGRVHLGAYAGNGRVLRSSDGFRRAAGVMAGWDLAAWPVRDASGEWSRIVFGADWMSGRNSLGGGGVCVNWMFSRNASVLTGPVWFTDSGLNGAWKWTVQFDGNL